VDPLWRAAALLGRPLPASKRRTGAMLLPLAMRQLLHRALPSRFLGSRMLDSEMLMEAGRVFDRLQRVYYYLGEDVLLLFANLSTLNLSELARPSAELAMAYANAAAVAGILPAHRLAERYFALALATLKETPDPAVASYIEMLAAVHLAGVGRTAESAQRAENAIALAERAGFFRRRDESLAVRGQLELTAGRLSRASPWLEMLDESASRRGDVHMKCWAALLRAQRAILAGDTSEAASAIESVAPTLGEIGRPEKIWAAGLEAYTAYRRGDEHVALDAADRAAALIAQGPPAHVYCFDAYARVAEVRIGLWNARSPVRPAERLARDARDACRVLLRAARIFPLAVPAAMLHEGSRRWAEGDRRRAKNLFLQGRAAARDMALPYYEGRLDLALASTLAKDSERSDLAEAGMGRLAEWRVADGAHINQLHGHRS
jgi:eukaryotic-like serine/threonine-protein kinase